jgi:hypothetical protein
MSWNYRIVRGVSMHSEEYFVIRTAWYDEGSDTPTSIGSMDMYPVGSSVDELRADIERMLLALNKPVLDDKDYRMGEKRETYETGS